MGVKSESFDYWCKKQYNEVVKADRPTTVSLKSQSAKPGFIELSSGLDMGTKKQPIRMELELPGGYTSKFTDHAWIERQKPKKEHPDRLALPSHLPVVETVIEPSEDTTGMVCIGREITEELDYTPQKLHINRF